VDIEKFKQSLADQGYSNATSVTYEPSMENEMHTHEFSGSLFVLEGEFTLVTEAGSGTYLPGETCKLDAGVLHSERAGPDGTTFLVGKK
jgi:quercetin dioxygenase-like cupin family protein